NDLAQLRFADAAPPLVNNVDARAVRAGDEIRDGLVRQVSAPVRWIEVVETLVREGVTTVVELGPGTVLGGLVKKIDKSLRVLNVEDPASLDATAKALSEA
ncbi:MAG TPA: malonyl CoA-acyl carrier protein transacylase, partial [Vicinamibacteria bacterium]